MDDYHRSGPFTRRVPAMPPPRDKAEEACPLHLDRSQLSNTFIFRVTLNPSVARIDLIPEGGPLPNYNNGKGSHGRILS